MLNKTFKKYTLKDFNKRKQAGKTVESFYEEE